MTNKVTKIIPLFILFFLAFPNYAFATPSFTDDFTIVSFVILLISIIGIFFWMKFFKKPIWLKVGFLFLIISITLFLIFPLAYLFILALPFYSATGLGSFSSVSGFEEFLFLSLPHFGYFFVGVLIGLFMQYISKYRNKKKLK